MPAMAWRAAVFRALRCVSLITVRVGLFDLEKRTAECDPNAVWKHAVIEWGGKLWSLLMIDSRSQSFFAATTLTIEIGKNWQAL